MKNDKLENVSFENLDAKTIRHLCSLAVGAMCPYDIKGKSYDNLLNFDLRIPVSIRLNGSYSDNKNAMWEKFSKDKEAVLLLLAEIVYRNDNGIACTPYLFSSFKDIDKSIILDDEIVNYIVANGKAFRKDGKKGRLMEGLSMFSNTDSSQLYSAFSANPVLVGNLFASYPSLFKNIDSNYASKDSYFDILKVAAGFMHKFDNDSPAVLHPVYIKLYRKEDEDLFNKIFLHLCAICRKEKENMDRVSQDLREQGVGGKARRHFKGGWLTLYLNDRWLKGDTQLVISAIQLVPPLFNLIHSSSKNSSKLRSFKRLYQLSGDA